MSYNSKYKGYEVEAFLDKIVDFENQEFVNKEVFTETLNSYVKNDTFDSKINTINSNINNINSDIDDVRIWKNKLADSLKYDNDKKCWYIDGDFYVTGIFGVGAAGEEGGNSGGGGGIDEDTLRNFLTENRYATEDWVTALGYITSGEVDTKLAPYATSASVTAQVSAVASGLLNLTERVTPIESWKDRLSKALKYNEQEQCWYIDGKFYVTETLGVGGIAEGGNGGSGGEGTLTGILVNGQKYDSPDEYGILSLPNYPTQEEFDGISERFQTIESYFSSSEDYDNTINKWNEIVSFLNATEGTTLAGILAAYTLKKDFNKLAVTVGENSQAIDNHETRIQTWEEWFNSTGKHLLYDKNSNALYSENFYTRGWNAAGGIGEAGSTPGGGGGGGRVNGITLNNVNYTEVDAYGNLIISELFATSTDAEALVEEIEKLKNAGHITADALIPYIKTTDADAKYSTKEYVDNTFATKIALQNLSLSVDKNAEDIVKHDGRIDSLEKWYNNVGKHILYDSDNKSVYTENFYTTKVLGAGAVGEEGNGGSGSIVDYDSVIQAIGYVPANEVTVDAISNEVSLINNEIDDIEKDIVTINQRFADYYTQDEADNKLTESINGLASDVAESLDTKANKDGSNATGNWGIGITGNAATATKLNDNSEYTIWGQKFFKDGKPSSVNGDMAVTGNASISGTTSVKTLKVGNIELTDDNGRLKVKGDVAVTGTLGVGGIGEEGGSSGGSGSVNGISIDGKTYSPTDGIIDLTQPFANVEVDLSDYYTKQEVDNKTAPLATRDFVVTEIGKIDLSPYAKSKDVQDTYATKKSLSTLQGEVDNIESILGLGEEAEGYINTWGEVKDFLDKISVTDDLADTLLGINTELGNKALGSDLDAAVKRVGTLEGYFDNGIAKKATADASGNTITSTYAKQATIITAGKGLTGGGSLASNRTINVVSANDGIIVNDDNIQLNTINNLSTDSSTKPLSAAQGKALSDRLAVFENWFKADGDDTIKTTFNFFTTKTLAAGAAGEAGGGTGGGATVDYDSVVNALGFTPANVIDLDALATTVGGKQDAINTLTQNAWEAVVAKTGEVDDKLDATTAASTYLKKTDAASTYLGINAKAVSAGTADSATKATNDASGNEITKTYATKTELSSKGTYSKPTDGIPKSDLANAVQVSLGKADSALQEEEDPIFSAHVASDITVEDIENWNEAHSWGNHATAGYATQSWVNNQGFALTSYLNSYLLKSGGTLTGELTIDAGASHGLNITGGGITSKIYNAGGFFILDSGSSSVNFTSSSLYCGANGYEIYHSGNLTDLASIRSNASLGASAYNTLSGYNLQDISENASLGATAYSSLSGYLSKSGGTIESSDGVPLNINSTAGYTAIRLQINGANHSVFGADSYWGTYLGIAGQSQKLGIKQDGTPYYNGNTLIHSGNIGSQSVNYATSAERLKGIFVGNMDANTCYNTSNLIRFYSGFGGSITNFPDKTDWSNGLLEIGVNQAGHTVQFFFAYNKPLYYRAGNTLDWHQIAFTDSNVASATKLATSRTIWGQSFDGSANIRGNLFLAPTTDDGNALSEKIVFTGYNGRYYGPMIGTVASSNVGGYGRKDFVVWQYNKASWASDTSGHEVALRINPSGNVTIGGSDLAGTNWKAYIDGSTRIANITITSGVLNTNRNVNTGALLDSSKMGFEIEPFASCVVLKGYNTSGKGVGGINIASSGNVGIGTTSPAYKLDVSGDVRATGNITASAFYMSSDETLKDFGKDIEIDFDRLKNLPKKYFTWKSGGDKQIGTSAQEVQKLFPEIVGKKTDGTLTVDYSRLTMPALAAIDKLYAENQELKADNQELKARLTKLERRIYG